MNAGRQILWIEDQCDDMSLDTPSPSQLADMIAHWAGASHAVISYDGSVGVRNGDQWHWCSDEELQRLVAHLVAETGICPEDDRPEQFRSLNPDPAPFRPRDWEGDPASEIVDFPDGPPHDDPWEAVVGWPRKHIM